MVASIYFEFWNITIPVILGSSPIGMIVLPSDVVIMWDRMLGRVAMMGMMAFRNRQAILPNFCLPLISVFVYRAIDTSRFSYESFILRFCRFPLASIGASRPLFLPVALHIA